MISILASVGRPWLSMNPHPVSSYARSELRNVKPLVTAMI
jgi:hypothetical protein